MEKAILCRNPKKHDLSGYDRVYIGNEFCQNLICSVKELEQSINLSTDADKKFSIVTPYVTDKGFAELMGCFDYLAKRHPGTEVIVNDFGVLDRLISRYQELVPVLGRVIGNHLTKGPPDLRPNSKEASAFFRAKGISRIECSNKGNFSKLLLDRSLEYSMYYPYMFIATGRRCMVGFGNTKANKGFDPTICTRLCTGRHFIVKHKQLDDRIIIYGNTHFIRKDDLPKLSDISRLVYMPEGFFNSK